MRGYGITRKRPLTLSQKADYDQPSGGLWELEIGVEVGGCNTVSLSYE
jgi:hypothetical protein